MGDGCLVCGRPPPYPEVFVRGSHRLVRCPGCGLVFQEPPPTDADLERAYYHDPAFTQALFGGYREITLAAARAKLELLEDLAGSLSPGRALDVGCSSGAWLEISGARGWRSTGIEPSVETARAAREMGLDVRPGTLSEVAPQLDAHSFDLITFWDVLEHVRDPRRELALARGLLAPGGILALSMPNEAGWYPRATYRLLARRSGVWEYPELPVHLYDFNPDTISRLLAACGYRVLGLRTWPVPYRYYRSTTLTPPTLGRGGRGLALGLAFGALRGLIYPAARLFGRSNYMGLAAKLSAVGLGSATGPGADSAATRPG